MILVKQTVLHVLTIVALAIIYQELVQPAEVIDLTFHLVYAQRINMMMEHLQIALLAHLYVGIVLTFLLLVLAAKVIEGHFLFVIVRMENMMIFLAHFVKIAPGTA